MVWSSISTPAGPEGTAQADLYVTRRATRTSPWEAATNLGPKVNSSYDEFVPAVSPDGLELYFSSIRPGGYGSFDFYVSKRATPNDPWGDPVNVGPAVNSPGADAWRLALTRWAVDVLRERPPRGVRPVGGRLCGETGQPLCSLAAGGKSGTHCQRNDLEWAHR